MNPLDRIKTQDEWRYFKMTRGALAKRGIKLDYDSLIDLAKLYADDLRISLSIQARELERKAEKKMHRKIREALRRTGEAKEDPAEH